MQICVPMSVEFEELLKARDNPSEEAQSKFVVCLSNRLFDLVCMFHLPFTK